VLALNQSAIKKDVHKLGLTPQLFGSQDMFAISVAPDSKKAVHQQRKSDSTQTTKATEPKQSKACFRESCEHHLRDGSCAPFVFLVKDRTLAEGQFVPIKLNGIGPEISQRALLHLGLQQLEGSVIEVWSRCRLHASSTGDIDDVLVAPDRNAASLPRRKGEHLRKLHQSALLPARAARS